MASRRLCNISGISSGEESGSEHDADDFLRDQGELNMLKMFFYSKIHSFGQKS